MVAGNPDQKSAKSCRWDLILGGNFSKGGTLNPSKYYLTFSKRQIEDSETEEVNITVSGQETFTAGDIGKFTSSFQVLNTDHVICHMEKSVKLNMQITIQKGRGYVPAEENKTETAAVVQYLLMPFLHQLEM